MNTAIHSNFKLIALALAIAVVAFLGALLASNAGAQTITGTVTATTTNSAATTTTATSTMSAAEMESRIWALEWEVDQLTAELLSLKQQIALLAGTTGTSTATSTTGGGTGSSATSTSSARITPQNSTIRAGANVDFNGRGFWANEQVTVMRGAELIGSARADSQGNFSTGSITVPRETGPYVYSFRGDWSGLEATATVNVDW